MKPICAGGSIHLKKWQSLTHSFMLHIKSVRLRFVFIPRVPPRLTQHIAMGPSLPQTFATHLLHTPPLHFWHILEGKVIAVIEGVHALLILMEQNSSIGILTKNGCIFGALKGTKLGIIKAGGGDFGETAREATFCYIWMPFLVIWPVWTTTNPLYQVLTRNKFKTGVLPIKPTQCRCIPKHHLLLNVTTVRPSTFIWVRWPGLLTRFMIESHLLPCS